jgi:Zn-dependent protease
MPLSWKLGRIAGIDVYLHSTFLVLLLLALVWGDLPMVLSVFGCVLLHEFGHALMAKRFGIGTEDITLYPIGGVARLHRMPRAPGAELLIALAGPAVNFAIVGALMLLGFLGLDGLVAGTAVAALLAQLVLVNLILGLFNLIPAFPMDGGRVLRALLGGWMGRAQATTIAASIGRTLALLFGLFGILTLLSTGNPMPIALAAFIYFAASSEENQVLIEERRRRYPVQDPGIWVAPAGYRWVHLGNGTWQLAPIGVHFQEPGRRPSPWN